MDASSWEPESNLTTDLLSFVSKITFTCNIFKIPYASWEQGPPIGNTLLILYVSESEY